MRYRDWRDPDRDRSGVSDVVQIADDDIRITVLPTETERYIFVYRAQNLAQLERVLVRWALDSDLRFSLRDAAEILKVAINVSGGEIT